MNEVLNFAELSLSYFPSFPYSFIPSYQKIKSVLPVRFISGISPGRRSIASRAASPFRSASLCSRGSKRRRRASLWGRGSKRRRRPFAALATGLAAETLSRSFACSSVTAKGDRWCSGRPDNPAGRTGLLSLPADTGSLLFRPLIDIRNRYDRLFLEFLRRRRQF
jgi:hypothetical protein